MNNNSVIDRLKKYCSLNPDVVKNNYIKGINPSDSKIVIEMNGETKNITIDELESNAWLNTNATEEPIEVMEEVVNQPQVEEQVSISTLQDMYSAAANKNIDAINKALETFAIDEKTGTINLNKAIKIITNNSKNNVVNAVNENKLLPQNLSNYDIQGNLLTPMIESNEKVSIDNLIKESFKNILVYVEIARLNNKNYTDEQITTAQYKYATSVQDALNLNDLKETENQNKVSEEITPNNVAIKKELKPDNDIKKAGFADILILTIIVITYAAIIINLITKLK